MLEQLRALWDVKSELSKAWELLAAETDIRGLDEMETLADALEQITVADLLEAFPGGFAIGPMAGLYQVVRPLGYDEKVDSGTLLVRRVFKS